MGCGKKKPKSSSNASAAYAAKYAQLQQETLNFQKQQYWDWYNVFQPFRENLSNLYETLGDDELIQDRLGIMEDIFNRIEQTREAQPEPTTRKYQQLQEIADVNRANREKYFGQRIETLTPLDLLQRKEDFLALGLKQQPSMVGNVSAASGMLSSALASQSAYQAEQSLLSMQDQLGFNRGINSLLYSGLSYLKHKQGV